MTPSPSSLTRRRALVLSPLLLASGFGALLEQVVWERQLRLVFGVTTAASAAVVAIFIAGLGSGSLWLGKRADRHPRPLAFYSGLELGTAALVAVSPLLLQAVRWIYLQLGGAAALGGTAATILRLVLAAVVIGPPTVLMGGTLPAAARAATTPADDGRHATGWLYGVNTVGAVAGALAATFFLVELLGNRLTVVLAAAIVALVGMTARFMSRSALFQPENQGDPAASTPAPVRAGPRGLPAGAVIAAAATSGFAFFLVELVAPRLLAPLLGGTVFTFGLVLAVALVGIGAGALLYGMRTTAPPPHALGLTFALEGLGFALPLMLGDRIALLALRLRPLQDFGFGGYALSAIVVASLVLLPGALVAGYQFPLLIALLGHGREEVGEDIGRAYAANTAGSMAGALAGGFVLMPLLSAPGCLRMAIVLLVTTGAVVGLESLRRRRSSTAGTLIAACAAIAAVAAAASSRGPTAVWRHGNIGAGRADIARFSTYNARRLAENEARESILRERDGREASVALVSTDEVSLMITGKSDATTRSDAATQVGAALLPALRHPNPRRALVVGLATGCTAGWLASVPTMASVDVVELEPETLAMAELSGPLNQDVLKNPRVRVFLDDAREYLPTTRARYDLVVSEPSNPYRAGVASLYTREFYEAVRDHLEPGGAFVQWVQGYEIDAAAVRLVLATAGSVFPHMELWELAAHDLALVASGEGLPWDVAELRRRISKEPYRTGLRRALAVDSLEGLLARLRGRDPLPRLLAGDLGSLNVDDQNELEFSFARTLGQNRGDPVEQIRAVARAQGFDRAPLPDGVVDDEVVGDELASMSVLEGALPLDPPTSAAQQVRDAAKRAYGGGDPAHAYAIWQDQPGAARSPIERLLVAEGATLGDASAAEELRRGLEGTYPTEALLLTARSVCTTGAAEACGPAIERAFSTTRADAWVFLPLARRAMEWAADLARTRSWLAPAVAAGLAEPFAVRNLERTRRRLLGEVTASAGLVACRTAFEEREPNPLWTARALTNRLACYEHTGSPFVARARADLQDFLDHEPAPLQAVRPRG